MDNPPRVPALMRVTFDVIPAPPEPLGVALRLHIHTRTASPAERPEILSVALGYSDALDLSEKIRLAAERLFEQYS